MQAIAEQRGAGEYGRSSIMLIEDDAQMREAVSALLEDHGYGVEPCAGAQEALRLLRTGVTPDVILLDLLMPLMNGWEFRVEQKREPRWAHIPVVALSADASAMAAAIDAQAFLTKPVDGPLLLETVEQLLRESAQERLKARAIELERLGSLGALTAGISHEINNPLAFVLGNLELAQRQASELEARLRGADAFSLVGLKQVLARAQRGADRIASVVRGVSVFARPDTETVLTIDVQDVLESSLQLASNEIRHAARLERAYEPVQPVRGNPAKLGQVFLNLLLNAVRAVGESPHADHVISVRTRSGPDRSVIVEVADTGRTLPTTLHGRLRDPFLSSGPAGFGMGLGLSVSRELVEAMGGAMEAESGNGVGTTLRVILPSHTRTSVLPTAPTPAPVPIAVRTKRPRVLVVDDEPMMCDLLSAVLSHDYDVAAFSDPRAALASILGGDFDVILCDLMMPDLTGMDLFEHVTAERPEMAERMIFISGGAFTDRARNFLATTRRPQVRKPFRTEELVDAIEAQLVPKH